MTFERAKKPRVPAAHTRSPRVHIVPTRGTINLDPETRLADGWLHLTVFAPEIPERRFRYSISKRYMLVWAEGSSHAQHQFVILPRPVYPHDHTVTFRNGVVDAQIRIRAS